MTERAYFYRIPTCVVSDLCHIASSALRNGKVVAMSATDLAGDLRRKFLAEGKTKKIFSDGGDHVIVDSKDDLTAGDGAKHDVIEGKGKLANQTTCNVFRLLQQCYTPLAFVEQRGPTRFYARRCEMIPLEVVIRREAHGSYLKRHPELKKGHVFPKLVLEFFLKTSGRKWRDMDLPKDDPFMKIGDGTTQLYLPDQPIHGQKPFLTLDIADQYFCSEDARKKIGDLAQKIFLILEKAWQLQGRKLVDLKVELGIDVNGTLLLADVIDNDSWRVVEDGHYIDKQVYRDGASHNEVTAKYQLVAELTGRFALPRQQIILWRGSETDDLRPFYGALEELGVIGVVWPCRVQEVTLSAHKQPVQVCEQITRLVQEVPDTVVIAYVGRSNGLGPILAAQVSVPVINVSSTWQKFPDDVWSSLHLPSSVPVATILDPKNAVLYALQILAMQNPKIWAELRMKRELRLFNFVEL